MLQPLPTATIRTQLPVPLRLADGDIPTSAG